MKKALLIIASVLLLLAGIGFYLVMEYGYLYDIYLFKPSPQKYVKIALSYMDYGYNSDSKEWEEEKKSVIKRAKNAETYEDTYPLLGEASRVAGGPNSFILPASESGALTATYVDNSAEAPMPEVSISDEGIVTIRLCAFGTDSEEATLRYENTVLDFLREHKDDIKGAIVDVRDNDGGNMYPMMASISPFIENGTIMSFKSAYMTVDTELRDDGIICGAVTLSIKDAFKMMNVPVAILQNGLTACSSEFLIITFEGRDNVKTFGEETYGYMMSPQYFELYDGAIAVVGASYGMSRSGKEYKDTKLAPDVKTDDPETEATEWLLSFQKENEVSSMR